MGISLTHLTMASEIKQDMPPSGGYKPIRYARRLPARPISAGAMFGITAAITVAGFAMVAKGNAARRNEEDEKIRARMALVPLLQAEEDRRYVALDLARKEEEAELMGWKGGTQTLPRYTTHATGSLLPAPLPSPPCSNKF